MMRQGNEVGLPELFKHVQHFRHAPDTGIARTHSPLWRRLVVRVVTQVATKFVAVDPASG